MDATDNDLSHRGRRTTPQSAPSTSSHQVELRPHRQPAGITSVRRPTCTPASVGAKNPRSVGGVTVYRRSERRGRPTHVILIRTGLHRHFGNGRDAGSLPVASASGFARPWGRHAPGDRGRGLMGLWADLRGQGPIDKAAQLWAEPSQFLNATERQVAPPSLDSNRLPARSA